MPIKEIRIPYPERVFTPTYFEIANATTRFIINKGGTGSGKSFASAQNEILIASQKRVNTLVIRKVSSTLTDSVIASFKNRIAEFDLWQIWNENKSERRLTCEQTKSQVIFKGLDDPEKMKSIEGINRIVIEEATELEIEDFFEINRRARGSNNIQITLNFNPIHEDHWLKKHFFDQEMPDCTFIHSTYKTNPWLTEKDREQIEYLKNYNYNQYRIYALGEWGVTENGMPWLHSFNTEAHTKDDIDILRGLPIYLSFDFNRSPATCVAMQMSPSMGTRNSFIHIIKEFGGEMQLDELCRRIRNYFPAFVIHVTGDRTGKQGDVGFEQRHTTYYSMIGRYLKVHTKMFDIEGRNMEHNDSRNICNTMFYNYENLYISREGCPNLIKDCINAQVDETASKPGVLLKDRKMEGGKFKLDYFDCMRYLFQTYFSSYARKVYMILD